MNAGNRLLRDVVQASGIRTWVDTTHGTQDIDATDTIVLIITRDPVAVRAGYVHHWEGHEVAVPTHKSLQGIARRYPHAPRVSYEELCAHPDAVIARLAVLLGIAPWPCPVLVVNQNRKWYPGPAQGVRR